MKAYKRLTQKNVNEIRPKEQRLQELEDKIEVGELVSKEWHDEQVLHVENEIERLKAENERLKFYNDKLSQGIYFGYGEQFSNRIEQEKANAVKEFAEKLKLKSLPTYYDDGVETGERAIFVNTIDELLMGY